MKITKEQFKKIVKEVLTEENEYQAFFAKALEKSGKSIPDMSDEEKKAFFDKIDSAWNGKGEKNEAVNESSLSWKDVDKYANSISNLTQIDTKDVKKFIEDNKLDIEKIFAIAHKTSQGKTDFVKAIKSAPNSSIQKAYIKTYANKSVKEAELTAGQKKIDVDGDGDIEGDDLADLRAGKKANESRKK